MIRNRFSVLFVLIAIVSCFVMLGQVAQAQKKPAPVPPPAPIAPAEKPADGKWDEIDQRLIFLMVRLANLESSLDAVNAAIGKTNLKVTGKKSEAKRAEGKNDEMDKKGGGPMHWSQFYGTTASFFYHPTGRNSMYYTETMLGSQEAALGSETVLPTDAIPINRPPQFDYIYRANENARLRAGEEVAALKGKIETLVERKHRLEAEQSGLWCEVAFRAVDHYDLHKKPLYRFEPLVDDSEPHSQQHLEVIKSATDFMRMSLSIINAAQVDQAQTFGTIKSTVKHAREKLDDTLLRQGVDATDKKTKEGKFAALAKILEDVANNLSDSYVVSVQGDKDQDQQRKDTFRALLQQSLVTYAQLVLALDEISAVMRDDYKVKPNLEKPIAFASIGGVSSIGGGDKLPPSSTATFQPKTVWSDDNLIFTVLERNGDVFQAKFQNKPGGMIREIKGTVKDGKVSWFPKDVKVIKGKQPGGENHGTFGSNNGVDTLEFVWRDDNGKSGTFTLVKQK